MVAFDGEWMGPRATDHGSASVAPLLGDVLRERLNRGYPSLRDLGRQVL